MDLLEKISTFKNESLRIDIRRRDAITSNLIFLHNAVVASERLLIEAAEEIDKITKATTNTLYLSRLKLYYSTHLAEERGHAAWLHEDLRSFGVREIPYDKLAMAMVGVQYFMIKHIHPLCLLGYMAVVEGNPTPIKFVEMLEDVYGKSAFRFLRYHSSVDLEHRKELFEIIDSAPPDLHSYVNLSVESTLFFMGQASSDWNRLAGTGGIQVGDVGPVSLSH